MKLSLNRRIAVREMYTQWAESELITAVSEGDTAAAKGIINRIIICDVPPEQIDLDVMRMVCAEIINTLLKLSLGMKDMCWSEYKALYLIPAQIDDVCQLAEAKVKIERIAQSLCVLSAGAYHEFKKQKYYYIAEYIDKNYTNPDLNVNMIAGEFHIDRSWLSKKFKEAFGIGIYGYIIKLRLKKAKMLLKTEMSIDQIAT